LNPFTHVHTLHTGNGVQVLYSDGLWPQPWAGDTPSQPLVGLNGPVARPLRSPC